MSKLLRGQQLFISKHITSQISHAESPEPPDPRPSTDFIPCISTYSNGGQLMNVYVIGLSLPGAGAPYYLANRLNANSFSFPEVPTPFRESKIDRGTSGIWANLDPPVKTYAELQRRHKAHFHLDTWVRLFNISHGPFEPWWFWIRPGKPGFRLAGDTTRSSGITRTGGTWNIAYTLALPEPDDWHVVLAHDHPLDTRFSWRRFNMMSEPWFVCEKNWLGIHHITHCDPNITPI